MKSTHARGVALVCVSAITFSTVGLFTKGVSADAWVVIFWRGVSAALFTFAYAVLRGEIRNEMRRFGWPATVATLLGASGTVAFIPAFKLTSIANVAMIWASAPFVTALLAWVLLKERPSRRVVLASCVAITGVFVVVSGSFGGGTLLGDALAFWMTLMIAGMMVLYRRWPDTPVLLPNVMASIVLLPVAAWFSPPMQVINSELMILLVFGLVFALASVTFTMGARILPPAEAALLSALETPLAPIWAFLLLSEMPTGAAMIGGAMIMMALLWSQMRGGAVVDHRVGRASE